MDAFHAYKGILWDTINQAYVSSLTAVRRMASFVDALAWHAAGGEVDVASCMCVEMKKGLQAEACNPFIFLRILWGG
jgi:hypothetical protein